MVPPDLRSIGVVPVVGISLNAGPFMSYSKSRPCPIARRAILRDPDLSVYSPDAGRKHQRPCLLRLTDNLKRKGTKP
jgi:hypothetical protein